MKHILLIVLFAFSLNAGLIGSAISMGKEKAFEKGKDTAKYVYAERKKIRKEKEHRTGTKGIITRTEDTTDAIKGKVTIAKGKVVESGKNVIGKENVKKMSRVKDATINTLIGKPIR